MRMHLQPATWATLVAIPFLAWGLSCLLTTSQADQATRQAMKFKLHFAQAVLEGIATENYPLIETNAVNLARLSQAAGWDVRQTPEYQRLTGDFRQAADNLTAAAHQQNIDAGTVAYFQLTVSCVNCHRYLRQAKMAAIEWPVGLSKARP